MKSLLLFLLIGTAVTCWSSASQANSVINSFESSSEIAPIQTYYSQVALSTIGLTNGASSLQVVMSPSSCSKITVPCPPSLPWAWQSTAGIAADFTNPGDVPITLTFRVDDAANLPSSATTDYRSGRCVIDPHTTETYLLPFVDALAPTAYGVIDLPYPGMYTAANILDGNPFNPAHIYDYQISISSNQYVTTLYVDNVRTVNPATMNLIEDTYGQYSRATWPGKIVDKHQAANQIVTEQANNAANPPPANYDSVGGWNGGPKQTATGWFHTVKTLGKWWLVDPSGNVFFDYGVDGVNFTEPTFTEGRTNMFTWLPATNDPYFGQFYSTASGGTGGPITSGTTFDNVGANLLRKYGSDFYAQSCTMAISRLKSWGFNAIGNSSNNGVYGQGVPIQVRIDVSGTYDSVPNGTSGGNFVPDPWDPNFDTALVSSIQSTVASVKSDPNLIGYYVGNEMSWAGNGTLAQWGLGIGVLALNSSASPAKQQFLSQLTTEYGTIAALNSAWGTTYASWTAMASPVTIPSVSSSTLSTAAKTDIDNFTASVAKAYFQLVDTELKKQDPNHLYLGCKFSSNYWTMQELQANAEYADAVSMDIYAPGLNTIKWNFLSTLNAPLIVGEYSMGATDMGCPGQGIVGAPSQAARATLFQQYVYAALSNPCIIGCNWFEYYDQPVTGRVQDGQNANYGFVNDTDEPYVALVAAARSVAANLYTFRSNATQTTVVSVSGSADSKVTLTASLTRVDTGAGLVGRIISFDVNGVTVGVGITNSIGVATLTYSTPSSDVSGTYLVGATFVGDVTDGESAGMGTLTLSNWPSVVSVPTISGSAGDAVSFQATLKRADTNTVIPNTIVSLTLGGISEGLYTTNSNGTIHVPYTIPYSSATGNQTISVGFAGSYTTNASTGTGTLSIVAAPTNLTVAGVSGAPGAQVVLAATLARTDLNQDLQNYNLTFSVNGKSVGTDATHSTGIAYCAYTIPAGTKLGAETISVSFSGNSSFKAVNATGTLTVN